MFYRSYGVVNQHSRTRPAHDAFYPFPLGRSVAVDRAFVAGRLFVSELTGRKTSVSILQNLSTIAAKFHVPLLMPAVQSNHHINHLSLFSNTVGTHIIQNKQYNFSITNIQPISRCKSGRRWSGAGRRGLFHPLFRQCSALLREYLVPAGRRAEPSVTPLSHVAWPIVHGRGLRSV